MTLLRSRRSILGNHFVRLENIQYVPLDGRVAMFAVKSSGWPNYEATLNTEPPIS